MMKQGFTTSFSVDQTPQEAFAAINNVRGWWSGQIEGDTDKLGAEFTYRYKDVHLSKQKITEFIPGKKVVWRVMLRQLLERLGHARKRQFAQADHHGQESARRVRIEKKSSRPAPMSFRRDTGSTYGGRRRHRESYEGCNSNSIGN